MNYKQEKKEFEKKFFPSSDDLEKPTGMSPIVGSLPDVWNWITQVFAKRVERKERKKLLKLIKEARDIFKGEDHIFVLDVLEQGLKNEK